MVINENTLEGLIEDLKSVIIEGTIKLDKLYYLLIIVEEAISRAQATGVEAGELVSF